MPKTLTRLTKVPDLTKLTGREWLRLLVEMNCSAFTAWCTTCRSWKVEEGSCARCGKDPVLLDDDFWVWVSKRIRRAILKNRMLLRTVKAEWESIRGEIVGLPTPPYPFPPQLAWLNRQWEKALPPNSRPLKMGYRHWLVSMVEQMMKHGLTQSEILDILNKEHFPDGRVNHNRRDYAGIPGEELRALSDALSERIAKPPDAIELWRIMQWVKWQRGNPLARLRGERVRGASESQFQKFG